MKPSLVDRFSPWAVEAGTNKRHLGLADTSRRSLVRLGSASQARNSAAEVGGLSAVGPCYRDIIGQETLQVFPACARTMCGLGGSRRSPFRRRTNGMVPPDDRQMHRNDRRSMRCNCSMNGSLPKCPVFPLPLTHHGPFRPACERDFSLQKEDGKK